MNEFDFMSISKILLAIGVITLYITVTFAILISLCRKRKSCSPYHVEFINTRQYKGIEKRKTARINVRLDAFVTNTAKSYKHFAVIENLGLTGIKCLIKDPPVTFEKNDVISIEIKDQKDIKDICIKCRIAWLEKPSPARSFGAEFLDKSETLENYLLHLSKTP